MKRLVVSVLLVFALVLAACSTPPAAEPEATTMVTEAPQPTAVPTEEPELPDTSSQTIVDLAIADGSFTTLAGALQATGLVETLQGEGPFTVFAPTDEAFAQLPEGTLESLSAEELSNILLYHVVPGKVMAADVVGLDGQAVDTALEGAQINISVRDGQVVLNDNVQVVTTDIEASNGVIHVIDAVLLPPADEMATEEAGMAAGDMMDIVDTAIANGSFTTLAGALQATGLVDTLKGEGPFTVFAPTDDAFASLPEGTLESLSPEDLTNILLYHVVPGKVMAADVAGLDGQMVDTALEGAQISISVREGQVYLNDNIQVVTTDIEASNGVIHVIDGVLLPPADAEAMGADGMAAGDMMDIVDTAIANGSFTTLAGALEATGLVETLKGEGPFTVFAPTDEAFASLPEGTLEALSPEELTNILLYHVVPGKVMAADVVQLDGQEVETALEGATIRITVDGDTVLLNDQVQVVMTDIETSNGVIHVIDSVLLPPLQGE